MENQNQNSNHETCQVSPQWKWLMTEIREQRVSFGEARIIFHHGEPVEIVELLQRKRYNQGN